MEHEFDGEDPSARRLRDRTWRRLVSGAELMELRTQLRRVRPSSLGQQLAFDDIILDGETHKVTRGKDELKLGPTEFRLLTTFMEKPGRVWSREQLLDRVWGRDLYVDTRTVDVHIGRLRKALLQYGDFDQFRKFYPQRVIKLLLSRFRAVRFYNDQPVCDFSLYQFGHPDAYTGADV